MKNPVRAQPVRVNRFTDSQHHDIVRPLHTLDATLDMFHARNGKYRDPKRSHDYDLKSHELGNSNVPWADIRTVCAEQLSNRVEDVLGPNQTNAVFRTKRATHSSMRTTWSAVQFLFHDDSAGSVGIEA